MILKAFGRIVAGYFAVGILTAVVLATALHLTGSPVRAEDFLFFASVALVWPAFWLMALIFALAALGAPH